MTTRQAPLLIEREDLQRLYWLLLYMQEPGNVYYQSKCSDSDAQYWLNLLDEMLCYDGPGKRHLHMVPATFHMRGWHTNWVEQFIAELPPDVKSREQVRLVMARQAAEQVDNQEYSTDLRLEARDSLKYVLAGLQAYADADAEAEAEAEDDEIAEETEEHIVRSTNAAPK